MDLLLWFYTSSYPPKLHRLFCPPQRTTRVDAQQPPHLTSLRQRQSRNNTYQLSCTPNVHISTTQRLRDFITRLRLPWRPCRPAIESATFWTRKQISITCRSNINSRGRTVRAATYGQRCHVGYGIPIPGEGDILVRSKSRRCERDQLLET